MLRGLLTSISRSREGIAAINASNPRFKAPDIESYLMPCVSSRKAKSTLNCYCHDHHFHDHQL